VKDGIQATAEPAGLHGYYVDQAGSPTPCRPATRPERRVDEVVESAQSHSLRRSLRQSRPPRAVIFGKEDLTIPSGQIQLCCVVPVLHAAETIDEQQCLASAHAEQDGLRIILIARQVVHPTTLSRNPTAVKQAAKPDPSVIALARRHGRHAVRSGLVAQVATSKPRAPVAATEVPRGPCESPTIRSWRR
jgi:hypothetical protein